MTEQSKTQLPPMKEVSFRLVYLLYKAGGRLSISRAVELLGEYFGLSDEQLGNYETTGRPIWTGFVHWSKNLLKKADLIEIDGSQGGGQWGLSKRGRELGRWAERFYEDRILDMPVWAGDYIGPIKRRIKRFVRGVGSFRPSDNELCRWVDLCYRLEMWTEGVDIFRRVLKDNVSNGLYQTAERQSRICEHRLADAGGDGDGDSRERTLFPVATRIKRTKVSAGRLSLRGGQMIIQGRAFAYKNAKDAMVIVLRELAKNDCTFLDRCSRRLATSSRTRRYLAKSLQELYPSHPELYAYHDLLPGGWLVGTNLSNQRKMIIIREAIEVAGLRFGKDVVVDF